MASSAATLGRLVSTTAASRAASAAEAAATPPIDLSSDSRAGSVSKPLTANPEAIRLRAIADPMMPTPITATLVD